MKKLVTKIQKIFQKLKLFSKYDSILKVSFGDGLSSHVPLGILLKLKLNAELTLNESEST